MLRKFFFSLHFYFYLPLILLFLIWTDIQSTLNLKSYRITLGREYQPWGGTLQEPFLSLGPLDGAVSTVV